MAAAAFVLVPCAASAYEAPGFEIIVSDTAPGPGDSVEVTIDGTEAGEAYTLTITSYPASIPSDDIEIAGTAAHTRVAEGSAVTWTVDLGTAADYYHAVTDATGALVADHTVTVVAPGAAGEDAAAGGPGRDSGVVGSAGFAVGSGALALVGAGLVAYWLLGLRVGSGVPQVRRVRSSAPVG